MEWDKSFGIQWAEIRIATLGACLGGERVVLERQRNGQLEVGRYTLHVLGGGFEKVGWVYSMCKRHLTEPIQGKA